MIGSEGGLPLPSAHTTVRTVPYTAVQVLRWQIPELSQKVQESPHRKQAIVHGRMHVRGPRVPPGASPGGGGLRARAASSPSATILRRTGCSARSGGTVTQWLPDPMSIPAALRCTRSRNFCSRVLRFERRGGRVGVLCAWHRSLLHRDERGASEGRNASASTLLNGITPCVSPMMFSRHPRAMLSNGAHPPVCRRPRPRVLRSGYQHDRRRRPSFFAMFRDKGRVGWLSS